MIVQLTIVIYRTIRPPNAAQFPRRPGEFVAPIASGHFGELFLIQHHQQVRPSVLIDADFRIDGTKSGPESI